MRQPTEAELDRAAGTLAAIARIPSLAGGVVVFEADGLGGGRWYDVDERPGSLELVWAPVPAAAGGEDLEVAAQRAIETAVEARQRELEGMAFALHDRGRDSARVVVHLYESS
jgi:hypothetical protein